MKSSPASVRKKIAIIRDLIDPPVNAAKADAELFMAIHHLSADVDAISADEGLFEEVIHLTTSVFQYRGRGSQNAAINMSRLLCYMTGRLSGELSDQNLSGGDLLEPAAKREPEMGRAAGLGVLQKVVAQARELVQGPPSRSHHTSRLRADAWDRLGDAAQIARDAEVLSLALKVARNERASSRERQAAIDFLPRCFGEDDPDEATVELLEELSASPADRDMLRSVLQAQIDLGLNDEFGAFFTMDDWKDAHPDDY